MAETKKSFFKDFFPKKIHFFFHFLPTFLLLLLFPMIFSQELRVKGNSCFQKKKDIYNSHKNKEKNKNSRKSGL